MSECDEYTPDLGSIRDWYSGAVDEYWCDTGMLRDEAEAAFDRAIAAHDQEVAEQRCLKICWHIDRLVEHADQMTRSDLLVAVDNLSVTADSIARGEGSE